MWRLRCQAQSKRLRPGYSSASPSYGCLPRGEEVPGNFNIHMAENRSFGYDVFLVRVDFRNDWIALNCRSIVGVDR